MSVFEKNHFFIRKMHSLFGVIPIGLFLLEHLYTKVRRPITLRLSF